MQGYSQNGTQWRKETVSSGTECDGVDEGTVGAGTEWDAVDEGDGRSRNRVGRSGTGGR